jgi:hypothetical protein
MSSAVLPLPKVQSRQESASLAQAVLPWWFGLTLFVSATLLFVVQPLFARLVLPLLGGTPAVWNTCVVFFQAVLLAGYLYSHLTTRYLSSRGQIVVHVFVLLLPWVALPISIAGQGAPPTEDNPIGWLLALMTFSVGLPFFAVSTSAPLLQRWFAGTSHPAARDPYFLYAASNLGSMIALLGYPVLIEPTLSLAGQSQVWTVGYALLMLLIFGCVALARFSPARGQRSTELASEGDRPTMTLRLRWVALGLVPSSLMLGVTTHLTTDIAAIPLLWVLPLALYLLTFIIVFSRGGARVHPLAVQLMPMVIVLVLAKVVSGMQMPLFLDMGLHLTAFFLITMVCHGELARTRPEAAFLTEFYLLMSLGGVLGGLFNALVAPIAFDRGMEYPIVIALACLLLPSATGVRFVRRDLLVALAAGVLTIGTVWLWGVGIDTVALGERIGQLPAILLRLGMAFVPVALCYVSSSRPIRFALVAGAILAVTTLYDNPAGHIRQRGRGFFGQIAVRHDPVRNTHSLVHGTTLHGKQNLDADKRQQALTYFHKTGPVGQLFAQLGPGRDRVGITGLGMGSIACYALPGQEWTYYEIDPVVTRVAEDERYFSCLADARRRGVKLNVVLGDARLRLADAPEAAYDLLILDSFSSDSVPIHLISHEALKLYLSRLAANGVMCFNISNRYLDLEPVLARLAREEGLTAYARLDRTQLDRYPDKTASHFVVMSRDPAHLAPLVKSGAWHLLREREGIGLWRDDFSNLLSVFMWRDNRPADAEPAME